MLGALFTAYKKQKALIGDKGQASAPTRESAPPGPPERSAPSETATSPETRVGFTTAQHVLPCAGMWESRLST